MKNEWMNEEKYAKIIVFWTYTELRFSNHGLVYEAIISIGFMGVSVGFDVQINLS